MCKILSERLNLRQIREELASDLAVGGEKKEFSGAFLNFGCKQPQMSKMSVGNLDVIYITIESVIGIFAVVGNALVIWAVKLNPALQKTTFLYIVSLALTDIAMGILVMPLAVMVSLGVIIHFYSCLFVCCLMMIFSHASILSLLSIAVDRYLRVKLPTR